MTTLTELQSAIQGVIQDSYYTDLMLTDRINALVTRIAAGVYMPNLGKLSPALPELIDVDTVDTTTSAYTTLPTDYQRGVFLVADSNNHTLAHPRGGDYYSFRLFLKQCPEKDLSESGSVYKVCVKGNRIYYQGIPSSAETLTLHFYRKPTDMSDTTDTPDGLPDHLQTRLIKHGVCMDIYGEGIEDGEDNQGAGLKYHETKFYEAMRELVYFVGIDAEPENIASDNDLMWMDEEVW